MSPNSRFLVAIFLLLGGGTYAHDHHAHNIPPGQYISLDAIDVILWLHIIIQTAVWMFIMGIVLDINRSRYHVPIQTLGIVLSLAAHFLSHGHGGRTFHSSSHSSLAPLLETWLIAQTVCGIYLKLHLTHRFSIPVRSFVLTAHAMLGFSIPVASWVQVVLGGFTALGVCHEGRAGECLVRAGVGSAVIGVGVSLIVLTFLKYEKRIFGEGNMSSLLLERVKMGLIIGSSTSVLVADWFYRDTTNSQVCMEILGMGIVWIAAFSVLAGQEWGLFEGKFARKLIPGMLLFINGWYISADQINNAPHVLYSALSFTTQAAGFSDILLTLLAHSQETNTSSPITSASEPSNKTSIAHFLSMATSYFILATGLLFISTHAEQIHLLSTFKTAPALLILLLHGASFLCFVSVLILMGIWNQGCVARSGEKLRCSSVHLREGYTRPDGLFQTIPLPDVDTFDLEDNLDNI